MFCLLKPLFWICLVSLFFLFLFISGYWFCKCPFVFFCFCLSLASGFANVLVFFFSVFCLFLIIVFAKVLVFFLFLLVSGYCFCECFRFVFACFWFLFENVFPTKQQHNKKTTKIWINGGGLTNSFYADKEPAFCIRVVHRCCIGAEERETERERESGCERQ